MSLPPAAANNQRPQRVAVIGGGISGLAAAHRVRELSPECEVQLFEASDRLGGVLQTESRDGFLIERSADCFITNQSTATDFCRRIGFSDELIPTNPGRQAYVVCRGKLQPVPDGFVLLTPRKLWPIMCSPILSWQAKLRLCWERFIPPRPNQGDESLASFARRRLGVEAFERLVQPLISGIYTADPEKLSLQATMPRFLEMERQWGSLQAAAAHEPKSESREAGARYSMFLAPRRGMSSLIQAAAAKLPADAVQLCSPISRVERTGNNWRLHFAAKSNQATRPAYDCDALIVATPAPVAATLVRSLDVDLADDLHSILHAGTAIVAVGFRRNQLPSRALGFGFVVPAIEKRGIIAGSFSSVKFPDRAPQSCVLIRVFVGGSAQPELVDLDDAALTRLVRDELAALIGVQGDPLIQQVIRWQQTMPQYHLGHCQLVDRIEQRARALPNFALAGNAYRGVGLPHCIRSGEQAAAHVLGRSIISRAPSSPPTR